MRSSISSPGVYRVRIRAAREADLARLGRLRAPEVSAPAQWLLPALRRAAGGHAAALVVEVMRRGRPLLAGCGVVQVWPRGAEIAEVQIAPAWRGRGLGAGLVRALEAHAARLGATRVELGVTHGNARARVLYARLGYRLQRAIRLDLGRGAEDVLVLERELGGSAGG